MVADIKPLKNVIGLAEPSWAVHADFYRYIEKTRFARFTLARNEKVAGCLWNLHGCQRLRRTGERVHQFEFMDGRLPEISTNFFFVSIFFLPLSMFAKTKWPKSEEKSDFGGRLGFGPLGPWPPHFRKRSYAYDAE